MRLLRCFPSVAQGRGSEQAPHCARGAPGGGEEPGAAAAVSGGALSHLPPAAQLCSWLLRSTAGTDCFTRCVLMGKCACVCVGCFFCFLACRILKELPGVRLAFVGDGPQR